MAKVTLDSLVSELYGIGPKKAEKLEVLEIRTVFDLIYYLILRMIRDYQSYSKLREENHVLSLQLMQYDGLNQRIALARQGRHDLRHHILTMENMVKEENYDALRSYLIEIGEKYQLEGPLNFCQRHPDLFFGNCRRWGE